MHLCQFLTFSSNEFILIQFSDSKESTGKEEILQCKGCNCYGLSDEFFNERACSADCEREVKQKLVIARKLEYDRNDVRLKKREKYYSLLKKEVQDQKHFGKDEIQAKLDKIEKIDIDKIDLTKLEAEIKGLDDFDEDSNIVSDFLCCFFVSFRYVLISL